MSLASATQQPLEYGQPGAMYAQQPPPGQYFNPQHSPHHQAGYAYAGSQPASMAYSQTSVYQ